MKHNKKSKTFIFLTFFITIGISITQVSLSKNLFTMDKIEENAFDGQILFSPFFSTTTYLIDNTSTINHTWSSTHRPFTEAYMLDDGGIMRPILTGNGVQKISWNGTIVWDYRYTVTGCTCHHDIEVLPNGNVLMIVWVTKTRSEAIAAGRNPNKIEGTTFTPDKIIEVEPTGPTSGDIVWEWHVWDHLIQDYDPSKDNYGVVGDHPELIDINYGDFFTYDWLHTNSVDYHPEFDQILIDVHNFNEVWVIDHSTTTEEAAGHTGGNYGKGGDLLYRWGNPEAYDAGTASDQKLFFQHDASWIKPGYPGEGNILVFNNGNNRPSGQYSTVDEFTPPVDSNGEYYLEPGSAYDPENYTWSYIADPPTSFFSHVYGGAQRLENGNTLICYGTKGVFFVTNPDKTTIWEWTNPYPNLFQNDVFKIEYIHLNNPPYEPKISGPEVGAVETEYEFTFIAEDPDEDDLWLYIDWGDDNPDEWIGPFVSGTEINRNHTWSAKGKYEIKAKVKDTSDIEGDWSKSHNILITTPPSAPVIDGPTSGRPEIEHCWEFHSTDPDDDNVSYYIDWGDGNVIDWDGPYPSCTPILKCHTYEDTKNYTISAKARDENGVESTEATFSINIPRNQPTYNSIFLWFLERFSLLSRLLYLIK